MVWIKRFTWSLTNGSMSTVWLIEREYDLGADGGSALMSAKLLEGVEKTCISWSQELRESKDKMDGKRTMKGLFTIYDLYDLRLTLELKE